MPLINRNADFCFSLAEDTKVQVSVGLLSLACVKALTPEHGS